MALPVVCEWKKGRGMIKSSVSIVGVPGVLGKRPLFCECCGGFFCKTEEPGDCGFYICFHDREEGHGRGVYVCSDCLKRGVVHSMDGVRDMLPGERQC
jgi:hypothetical protein